MTRKEFIERLKSVAALRTYYVKGGFGIVLNEKGKERVIKSYKYNKDRADKIRALPDDTFGFDCCGLIKGVIWGFWGNELLVYGGASYKSNGLDDLGEKGLLNICTNLKDITSYYDIEAGDFLYMPGHCGIYIGDGKVIESTPSGKCGVQITDFERVKWKASGKLPFIKEESANVIKPVIPSFYLKVGSRGMNVYNLQRCLNFLGADLVTDGAFGPKTKRALMDFQKKNGLVVDGVYGPISQKKLREVIG